MSNLNDVEYWFAKSLTATSTAAGNVVIATVPIPTNSTVLVEARVSAWKTSSGTPQGACYVIRARFKNIAGTVSKHDETANYTSEDNAAWDCNMAVNGTNGDVRVVGAASTTINWKAKVFGTLAV